MRFLLLLSILLMLSSTLQAQAEEQDMLHFEVNEVYPYLSLSAAELSTATRIRDINKHFKPAWVRNYHTVVVQVVNDGNLRKAVGNTETFTTAQKALLSKADPGTAIEVIVDYLPENTLTQNEPKEMSFSVYTDPDQSAVFKGGDERLRQYLWEKAIVNIPTATFSGYDLTAVTFTIAATGEVTEIAVTIPSKEESIDQLLLTAVTNMPCWQPAVHANGISVPQSFTLTVGNMENCMVNTLNIRR